MSNLSHDTAYMAEWQGVIASADVSELRLRPADLETASTYRLMVNDRQEHVGANTTRGPIGLQGMVLDAMERGSLDSREAKLLLADVCKRLGFPGPGVSRITDDGGSEPIGEPGFIDL
jgi:hypothetical protein